MDMGPLIGLIAQAVLDIYRRHAAAGGSALTDAAVLAKLDEELAAGKHEILGWFLTKGRPAPTTGRIGGA